MRGIRSPWVNVAAALVGAVVMLIGILRLMRGFWMAGTVWSVLGFLLLGWAIFDRRKFLRGTPESEVDGGRTIE